MTFVEFSGLLSNLAVLVASVVTILGIYEWRVTYFAKKRIELAEKLLASFDEVKELVGYARNPFADGGEGRTRPRREGEDEEVARTRDNYFVPLERLHSKQELISELYSLKYRYKVLFGVDDKPFVLLNKALGRIRVAANVLIRQVNVHIEAMRPESQERFFQRQQENEAAIWEGVAEANGEVDPINPLLGEMMEELERVCMPYIDPALPFWARWERRLKDGVKRGHHTI